MASILMVGMGPLLDTGVRNFGAPCLRTWQFAKPLIDAGHIVRLVTLPIHNPDDPDREKHALVSKTIEDFKYQALTSDEPDFALPVLTQIARSFAPDAIVAVNPLAAWFAAQIPMAKPLWADLNGYELANRQGQAARIGDDQIITEAWQHESLVLRRADKISTVSRPHLYAILGEMASIGRLNRHTFNHHFVHHIPNAYHPVYARPVAADAKPVIRGSIVPDDAFVMLWSGSYSSWTDPRMLFDFIERVLEAEPSAHYVSTGGGIGENAAPTYAEFSRLANKSEHHARYHLLGWRPGEEMPNLYSEVDLGLCIDEPSYQTVFGARNRIVNFMAAGVPVLATLGTELTQDIYDAGCAVVVPPQNADALVEGALRLLRSPDLCVETGQRARQYALEELDAASLVAPVLQWIESPELAPDNTRKRTAEPGLYKLLSVAANPLEANADAELRADNIGRMLDKAEHMRQMRKRRAYRVYQSVARLKNAVLRRRKKTPTIEETA